MERQNDYAKVNKVTVTRVHEGRKGLIFFDIVINDVFINGMSIVSGDRGEFLSFPSHKGEDGKWYKYAWIKLSEEDADYIIKTVKRKLNE